MLLRVAGPEGRGLVLFQACQHGGRTDLLPVFLGGLDGFPSFSVLNSQDLKATQSELLNVGLLPPCFNALAKRAFRRYAILSRCRLSLRLRLSVFETFLSDFAT